MKEYLNGLKNNKVTKVKFGNHGRKKQHETTLIELYEKPFDIAASTGNKPTYAESLVADCHMQAKEYLKIKGFEDTNGYFDVINGKIVKCDHMRLSLLGAIEERDKRGQGGEYLAAKIDHYCKMLPNKLPPIHTECSEVFDIILLIQNYHFQLYLLEQISPQYSAGQKKMPKTIEKRSRYEAMVLELFKECKRRNPTFTKEDCYLNIYNQLEKTYKEDAPKASVIKGWLKSNKSLLQWWKIEEAEKK